MRNLLIREGFYQRCDDNLAAYLREKAKTNLDEIVISAQRYVDVHGGHWGQAGGRESNNQHVSDVMVNQAQQTERPSCSI